MSVVNIHWRGVVCISSKVGYVSYSGWILSMCYSNVKILTFVDLTYHTFAKGRTIRKVMGAGDGPFPVCKSFSRLFFSFFWGGREGWEWRESIPLPDFCVVGI